MDVMVLCKYLSTRSAQDFSTLQKQKLSAGGRQPKYKRKPKENDLKNIADYFRISHQSPKKVN
jgi:hypothetical protein